MDFKKYSADWEQFKAGHASLDRGTRGRLPNPRPRNEWPGCATPDRSTGTRLRNPDRSTGTRLRNPDRSTGTLPSNL